VRREKARGSALVIANLFTSLAEGATFDKDSELRAKSNHSIPSSRKLFWAISYSKPLFLPCLCIHCQVQTMPRWHGMYIKER